MKLFLASMICCLAPAAMASPTIVVQGVMLHSTPLKSLAIITINGSIPILVRNGDRLGDLMVTSVNSNGVTINRVQYNVQLKPRDGKSEIATSNQKSQVTQLLADAHNMGSDTASLEPTKNNNEVFRKYLQQFGNKQ